MARWSVQEELGERSRQEKSVRQAEGIGSHTAGHVQVGQRRETQERRWERGRP